MEDEKGDIIFNQEQFKKLHCRMYENKYPQIDDLVYVSYIFIYKDNLLYQCKIDEKIDNGEYSICLLEYDNIPGLLFTTEKSNSKKKKFNNNIFIGKEEVLRVLRVDPQKGFIDLSNKNLIEKEKKEIKEKFEKSKTIENIIKILSVHTNKSMEYLYKNIIWPLYKSYHHALDALKYILNGDENIFENMIISDEIKNELISIIKSRLAPQPIKIKSVFKLICYTFNGIDDIRQSLLNGKKIGTKDIPINFKLITPPLYECEIISINKNEGFKIMESGLTEVKKNIEEKGGYFKLIVEPRIIGEKEEEKSIEEQIREALKNKKGEKSDDEEEQNDIFKLFER